MDTDNQDGSVEQRLAAFFGGEQASEAAPEPTPEPQAEAVEETDEQTAEADETDDEKVEATEEEADPNEVEIELDGETYKVPPKLKDAVMRQQDYAVKTQVLASERRMVEDRAQYLEAREQLLGTAYQEAAEYRALQMQLEQFDALDWASLAQKDMQQAYTLDLQRQELRRQIQAKEKTLQEKVQHVTQAQKMHQQKQLELGSAELQRRIGTIKPEDRQATWKQGLELGFTEGELSTIADARVMHALYKAAKWDALQAGKQAAVQKVSKAPPVVKPGATVGNQAVQAERYKTMRGQLKKTGRLEDAAAIFDRFLK